MMMAHLDDEVTLVDAEDQVSGQMDKKAAHRYPLFLHRAVSVWLFRHQGTELLLQQRSQAKITGAGWWGNTICGNVWPDESYEACAQRRLEAEMGIVGVELKPLYTFKYKAYVNSEFGEYEMDRVFTGEYQGKIQPRPEEATDYIWVNWQEFQAQIKAAIAANNLTYPLPEGTLEMNERELQNQTVPLTITLNGKSMTIVPWTVMMVMDGKIRL